jgi:hypothetical protein
MLPLHEWTMKIPKMKNRDGYFFFFEGFALPVLAGAFFLVPLFGLLLDISFHFVSYDSE